MGLHGVSFLRFSQMNFVSTLLLKLCPWIPDTLHIAWDLCAIFGGGIFCSTLVSWFVEAQNAKRNKEEQARQREYILAATRNSFIRMYERELVEISNYHIKYISCKKQPWSIEHLEPCTIANKLIRMLAEIETAEMKVSSEHVITTDTIRRSKQRYLFLVKQNQLYYQMLHQNLLELATHFTTHLISGIFTEQQIESLKVLTMEIHDILAFAPEDGIGDGTILEFKKMLFEKTSEILPILNITAEEKVRVHYRDVFKEE